MTAASDLLQRAAAKLRGDEGLFDAEPLPVDLALASAMDEVAKAVRLGSDMEARLGYGELIACAREVLREPTDGAR